MEQTIVDWLNWLRLRSSEKTVAAYGWQLRRLAKDFPTFAARDFKPTHLTQYLAERRFLGEWGDSSVKMATCALRSFFGWALGKSKSPARRLPVHRVKERKQRSLTEDQLGAVLVSCDTSTKKGQRDVALIALMADSGLRASEVCRLRLVDLDLDNLSFRVVIKGGDEDVGLFSPETRSLLASWLAWRGECGAATVFVSVEPGKAARSLTPGGLRCIFRKMAAGSGLEKFSPHDLRRTFATLATDNGAPSRLLQMGMRVNDIRLVQRYSRNAQLQRLAQYLPMSGTMGG